jgi:aminobenzoyl-glutamate transport protein
MRQANGQKKNGLFNKFLSAVEWLGNLLPHPVTLFFWLCVGMILFSGAAYLLGWSATDPRPGQDAVYEARTLISAEGLRWIVTSTVTNFSGFAPLGTVLVMMLGIGVAEKSGLLGAAVRATVVKAPKQLLTFALVFAGVVSNAASELGYVVLIPLGGVIFHSVGRNPIVGMAAAFAGVSGGYSANFLIGTVDPLLAGITTEAARIIDPGYNVHPLVNWYFMSASCVMVSIAGTWVTSRIVEPRMGAYEPSHADDTILDQKVTDLTKQEKRGLIQALLALVAALGIIAALLLPPGAPLRNPDPALAGNLLESPILHGVVPVLLLIFFLPSFVYGRNVGTIRNDKDIIDGMSTGMRSMGLYIVLVFFAAQFIEYFKWTNLGQIVSMKGAETLLNTGMTGPIVFVGFILFCCFVNLMIGSASAQWALTAPIFVPMLMTLGYSPEVIQAAYRIGDSTTNIITPMMTYFGLIMAVVLRYDSRVRIGTMIGMMLPYFLYFLAGWLILFYLWFFVAGLPPGPGAPIYYTPPAPAP